MTITSDIARDFQKRSVQKRQQNTQTKNNEAAKFAQLRTQLQCYSTDLHSNDGISAEIDVLRAHVKRIDLLLSQCDNAKDWAQLMRARTDAVEQLSIAMTGGKPPTNRALKTRQLPNRITSVSLPGEDLGTIEEAAPGYSGSAETPAVPGSMLGIERA